MNASQARNTIYLGAQERAEEASAARARARSRAQGHLQQLNLKKLQRAISGRTPYGLFEQEEEKVRRDEFSVPAPDQPAVRLQQPAR